MICGINIQKVLDVMQFVWHDKGRLQEMAEGLAARAALRAGQGHTQDGASGGGGLHRATLREGAGRLATRAVPSADFSKETDGDWGGCRGGVNVHPCTVTPKTAIRGRFSLGYWLFPKKNHTSVSAHAASRPAPSRSLH